MRLMSLVLIVTSALFLTACASLNKDECMTADWQMIGYGDGSNGASADRLQSHRKACAKHSVTPDFSSYQKGYDEGVRKFCTERNGFDKARSGYRYQGICPSDVESGFLKGYEAGREFYVLNQKIRTTENAIRLKEQEIKEVTDEIELLEVAVIEDPDLEDRKLAAASIKELKAELIILEDDLEELIIDMAGYEGELKQLEEKSTY